MYSERLSYSLDEAVTVTGLNRNALYHLMNKGELATFKIGKRRMVSARVLREFIERKERDAIAAGMARDSRKRETARARQRSSRLSPNRTLPRNDST